MSENDPKPDAARMKLYWKKNIRCVLSLLVVWFIVSYGCSILFVDELDQFRIPGTGFKVGFWFAQQGSILTFLALIAIYVRYMNKLDKEFDVEEQDS